MRYAGGMEFELRDCAKRTPKPNVDLSGASFTAGDLERI